MPEASSMGTDAPTSGASEHGETTQSYLPLQQLPPQVAARIQREFPAAVTEAEGQGLVVAVEDLKEILPKLKPSKEAQQSTGQDEYLTELYAYTRPYLKSLGYAMALLTAGTITATVLPGVFRGMMNDLSNPMLPRMPTHQQAAIERRVISKGLAILGLYLAKTIATQIGNMILNNYSSQVLSDIRRDLFEAMVGMSEGEVAVRGVGRLVSLINTDAGIVKAAVSEDIAAALQNSLYFATALCMCLSMNVYLTGVMLVAILPAVLLIRQARERIQASARRTQESSTHVVGTAESALSSTQLVKAFGREAFEEAQFAAASLAETTARRANNSLITTTQVVGGLVSTAAGCGVMYVGYIEVASNRAKAGDVMSFAFYMLQITGCMEGFARVAAGLSGSVAAWVRLQDILRDAQGRRRKGRQAGGAAEAEAAGLDALTGACEGPLVEFQGVSFAYAAGAEPVLQGVAAAVHEGHMCAIVGPSGGGKSTLLSLVPKFAAALEGRVLVGGRDVQTLSTASLRAHIGWVPQSAFPLSGTIAHNIRYGKLDATDEEVREAAAAAGADEFISKLPQGYSTPMYRYHGLSGGQIQRIAIARALVRQPSILILDEPASALDALSESSVMSTIWDYSSKMRCTCLVVAHRLRAVQRAHQILVMDGGKVAEAGTHEQLYNQTGSLYRYMYDIQDGQ